MLLGNRRISLLLQLLFCHLDFIHSLLFDSKGFSADVFSNLLFCQDLLLDPLDNLRFLSPHLYRLGNCVDGRFFDRPCLLHNSRSSMSGTRFLEDILNNSRSGDLDNFLNDLLDRLLDDLCN